MKTVCFCMFPYSHVVCMLQMKKANMATPVKKVLNFVNNLVGDVLIKKKFMHKEIVCLCLQQIEEQLVYLFVSIQDSL